MSCELGVGMPLGDDCPSLVSEAVARAHGEAPAAAARRIELPVGGGKIGNGKRTCHGLFVGRLALVITGRIHALGAAHLCRIDIHLLKLDFEIEGARPLARRKGVRKGDEESLHPFPFPVRCFTLRNRDFRTLSELRRNGTRGTLRKGIGFPRNGHYPIVAKGQTICKIPALKNNPVTIHAADHCVLAVFWPEARHKLVAGVGGAVDFRVLATAERNQKLESCSADGGTLSAYGLPYGKSRCSAIMMRPGFCPEKPGFYQLKHLNEYVERLSYLGRLGYAEGDTALYHPTTDYYASTEISERAIKSFGDAGKALEAKNIAFDIIDDTAILDAEITPDGLKLGDAVYRHIVVPENKYMPEAVRKKIEPYLGEGTPTYVFKNKDLRVLTRKLDTGRLWFVFNEGIEPAREVMDIADGKRVYRIDPSNGRLYSADTCEVELSSGDIAVFLVTENTHPCSADKVTLSAELTAFKPISYKQFIYEFEGLSNVFGEGEPDLEKTFSGEVTYEAEYELPETPKEGELWRIRLEDFGVWASVKVGDTEKTMGITPMTCEIPAKDLLSRGKITLTVANTAADELCAKRDVIYEHPIYELAPMYQQKALSFEENAQKFKFGRVFIEKLS